MWEISQSVLRRSKTLVRENELTALLSGLLWGWGRVKSHERGDLFVREPRRGRVFFLLGQCLYHFVLGRTLPLVPHFLHVQTQPRAFLASIEGGSIRGGGQDRSQEPLLSNPTTAQLPPQRYRTKRLLSPSEPCTCSSLSLLSPGETRAYRSRFRRGEPGVGTR